MTGAGDGLKRYVVLGLAVIGLSLSGGRRMEAQGTAEGRYVGAAGYTMIQTPALRLRQTGFELQAGRRTRSWMVTGFDFGQSSGLATMTASQFTPALQAQLAAGVAGYQAAGLLPASYQFQLPSQTKTSTFSFGPQLMIHLRRGVLLLGNPALGALRERTTPLPADAFQTAVVQQTLPAGTKLDWAPFFGGSGGVNTTVFSRVGIKAQVDVVHSHPFNDLLARGNWSYRSTFGLSYTMGRVRGKSQ